MTADRERVHDDSPVRRPHFPEQPQNADSAIVYNVVAQQMQQHDLLMWQVPVLSLTAQAFLLTIVLGGSSAPTSRVLASSLALLASVLSMQLMAKHRWHVQVERKWLADFERKHQLDQFHKFTDVKAVRPKASGQENSLIPRLAQAASRAFKNLSWTLIKRSSFALWQVGLGLFGIVAVLCLILSVVQPSLLAH